MVLGITGKSGTGKHTAAAFLAQRGWKVLDADKIAHQLYRPYTHMWKGVVKAFGEGILNRDDTISRQALSRIVFDPRAPEKSQKALKKLEKITHPAIRRQIREQLHRLYRRRTDVIIVAALWDKIRLPELCDKLLLTVADERHASRRVQKRDGITSRVAAMRIKNQPDPPDADFIVENNGSFQRFYRKLADLPLK